MESYAESQRIAPVFVEHADWSHSNIEAREVIIGLGHQKGISIEFREEEDGSLYLYISTDHEHTSDAIMRSLSVQPVGANAIQVHVGPELG